MSETKSSIALPESLQSTRGLSRQRKAVSRRALGAMGLGSGLIGLAAVILGFGSWLILGTALVVWCFSGWHLFFAGSRSNRVVRVLGYFFLSTGFLVAAAIVLKLYLLALGPAWKL
jgi:hypothetical protein